MSPASLRTANRSLLRLALIWVLAVALPVHGLSGLLAQMLGAEHRHAALSQPGDGHSDGHGDGPSSWSPRQLLRAVIGDGAMELIDAAHARQRGGGLRLPQVAAQVAPQVPAGPPHVHGAGGHVHGHGVFERHHHDAADGSVVALGAKEDGRDAPGGASQADAGGGFLLPPPPASLAWMPGEATAPWRSLAAAAWCSHTSAPPEPPPRA